MGSSPFEISAPPQKITFFVFKPQTLIPGGNVFNDWAALYAQLTQTSGFRQIFFDGTDDTFSNNADIIIPAGTYDLYGVQFTGSIIGGNAPSVICDDLCFFTNFADIGQDISVSSQSTQPVVTATAETIVSMGFNAQLGSSTVPFFEVNNAIIIILVGNNSSLNIGSVDLTASFFIPYLVNNASFSSNTVTGDAASTVEGFITVGSAVFSQTQSGFSGTIFSSLQDLSAQHFFDKTVKNFLVSGTVQDAIDELSTNAINLVGGVDRVTMTAAGNHTIANNTAVCLLHATGTIASYTVKMPSAPLDGQHMSISFDQIVTTLTVQANSGQTIVGTTPVTATLGGAFRYVYDLTLTKWWPA